jgi:hypothetical protein
MIKIKIFSKKIVVLKFYFDPIISVHSTKGRTRSRAGPVLVTNGSGYGSRRPKIYISYGFGSGFGFGCGFGILTTTLRSFQALQLCVPW